MPDGSKIRLMVDGIPLTCTAGQSVASALLTNRIYLLRRSPNAHSPRGPFCMMGACQECAIYIDGAIRRACQTEVQDGMTLELRGAGTPASESAVNVAAPDHPS